jgi:hypothetical protein
MLKKLNEGLRAKDLEGFVTSTFLIDTYKSKMGEDRDVAVLSFRVADRLPALDLMEFVERGYSFVLDADISSGEESDGKYSVFVEIERNNDVIKNINQIIEGVSKLTGIDDWRFRYHKEAKSKSYNLETIAETMPSTPEKYDLFLNETRNSLVKDFFNDVMYDDVVVNENIITLYRPFTDGLKFELQKFDHYTKILDNSNIKLDEQSSAEVMYLNKIFGSYDVVKIGDSFMVKKNDQAILIKPL